MSKMGKVKEEEREAGFCVEWNVIFQESQIEVFVEFGSCVEWEV